MDILHHYYFLTALLLTTALWTDVSCDVDPTVVTIEQGTLRGKTMNSRSNKPFAAFLSIPYAEPPINKLRLMPPIPAGKWNGERNATHDSPACFQQTTDKNGKSINMGREDCLYVNVYTPQNTRTTKGNLPVMVFVHGGSFTSGDSKSSTFGPEYLLDKDIVLVTFNYRLGLLGFLSMENDVLPGNNGLKDQAVALKWVNKNIRNFGGNPEDITLFGQSAGAVSVAMHLISPLSKGLFQRVITQSGTSLNFWSLSHPGKRKDEANYFAIVTGCIRPSSQKTLECFQGLKTEKFILSSLTGIVNTVLNSIPYNIGIVREPAGTKDAFLTTNPYEEIVKPSNITWIIGVNSGEGVWTAEKIYPVNKLLSGFVDILSNVDLPLLFGYSNTETKEVSSKVTSEVKNYYFGKKSVADSYSEFANLSTDRGFLQPAIDSAKYYPGPKYFYYFDFINDFRLESNSKKNFPNIGPSHGDELANLFYLPEKTPNGLKPDEQKISEAMVEYWTNFAIYGTPSPPSSKLPKWNPVSTDNIEYLYISKDVLEMRSGPKKQNYDLWNKFGLKKDF